jgi:4-amino-4-deoxy-L-arabinose transferase-like glycosyltransferase
MAALLLLGGGLRLVALEAAEPLRPIGDENYYVQVANHIAQGRGHLYVGGLEGPARAWRPPAHAWLLSRLVDASPIAAVTMPDRLQDPALLRRLATFQVALGTLLVLLTASLGVALFDARTGLTAGALAAVYPALIAHSHYLWSETFFAVLITAALLGVVGLQRRPGWGLAALTGLVFGAAALTREIALLVGGVCAGWCVWTAPPEQRRQALARGALMLGIAALVVLPWTVRNYQLFGRLVPVSTVGWFAAAEGNSLESPQWLLRKGPVQSAFHRDYFSLRDEVQRLDLARRHALERIAAEQPGWLAKKTIRNLALLLNPDSVLRMKIRRGAYGDRPPAVVRALLAASIPFYLALATAGVLGIAAACGPGRRALPCLVLGAVALLHVVTNATPRFRVPWLPLLAVYASHAALGWRELPRRLDKTRGALAVAALLFFFGVCVPYFYRFGGRP